MAEIENSAIVNRLDIIFFLIIVALNTIVVDKHNRSGMMCVLRRIGRKLRSMISQGRWIQYSCR